MPDRSDVNAAVFKAMLLYNGWLEHPVGDMPSCVSHLHSVGEVFAEPVNGSLEHFAIHQR